MAAPAQKQSNQSDVLSMPSADSKPVSDTIPGNASDNNGKSNIQLSDTQLEVLASELADKVADKLEVKQPQIEIGSLTQEVRQLPKSINTELLPWIAGSAFLVCIFLVACIAIIESKFKINDKLQKIQTNGDSCLKGLTNVCDKLDVSPKSLLSKDIRSKSSDADDWSSKLDEIKTIIDKISTNASVSDRRCDSEDITNRFNSVENEIKGIRTLVGSVAKKYDENNNKIVELKDTLTKYLSELSNNAKLESEYELALNKSQEENRKIFAAKVQLEGKLLDISNELSETNDSLKKIRDDHKYCQNELNKANDIINELKKSNEEMSQKLKKYQEVELKQKEKENNEFEANYKKLYDQIFSDSNLEAGLKRDLKIPDFERLLRTLVIWLQKKYKLAELARNSLVTIFLEKNKIVKERNTKLLRELSRSLTSCYELDGKEPGEVAKELVVWRDILINKFGLSSGQFDLYIPTIGGIIDKDNVKSLDKNATSIHRLVTWKVIDMKDPSQTLLAEVN